MTRSSGVPWDLLGPSWDPLALPSRLPEVSRDRPGAPLSPILPATRSETPKRPPKHLQREAKWSPNRLKKYPDCPKKGRSFPLFIGYPFICWPCECLRAEHPRLHHGAEPRAGKHHSAHAPPSVVLRAQPKLFLPESFCRVTAAYSSVARRASRNGPRPWRV